MKGSDVPNQHLLGGGQSTGWLNEDFECLPGVDDQTLSFEHPTAPQEIRVFLIIYIDINIICLNPDNVVLTCLHCIYLSGLVMPCALSHFFPNYWLRA